MGHHRFGNHHKRAQMEVTQATAAAAASAKTERPVSRETDDGGAALIATSQ
jgi:hypothetical protein